DGKIIVGGEFTILCGEPRKGIGRLNADGTLDATFVDPRITSPFPAFRLWSVALQPDGKILIGGSFALVNGQPRDHIARLTSGTAPLQTLEVDDEGMVATWRRSGNAPELARVSFETSSDGVLYTPVGEGARIAGGWQTPLTSTPLHGTTFVRARGWAMGAVYANSSSIIEAVGHFYRVPPPLIFDARKFPGGPFVFS